MPRKLRIAASVFFAVVAVALVVLWVRSYWCDYCFYCRLRDRSVFISDAYQGNFGVGIVPTGRLAVDDDYSFTILKIENDSIRALGGVSFYEERIAVRVRDGYCSVTLPGWIPSIAMTLAAFISYYRIRFSLRTLLIATTLVAVVLGLGVWAAS